MARSGAAPIAAEQAARPRYSQAQIDQFVAAHERFQRGEPRGHRAIMRFLQAPGIDFSDRLLVEVDLSGANLTGACRKRMMARCPRGSPRWKRSWAATN